MRILTFNNSFKNILKDENASSINSVDSIILKNQGGTTLDIELGFNGIKEYYCSVCLYIKINYLFLVEFINHLKLRKMKKVILFCLMLASACLLNAQIQVNSDGNVGIGTTTNNYGKLNVFGSSYFEGPTSTYPAIQSVSNNASPAIFITGSSSFNGLYLLYVGGNAIGTAWYTFSDLQLKNNVTVLDGKLMLSKIMNLDGKKYEFKSKEELEQLYKNNLNGNEIDYSNRPTNLPKGEMYGFIAQEIEKEFPELVKTDSATNLKAIDYDGMIPILLQSIKEQQKMILQLQEQINEISVISKERISNRKSQIEEIESTENALFQNAPNPFSQSSTIRYYLIENTLNAKICLYDMNGTQLRSIKVNGFGQGKIVIDAKQLKAGIYLYSLIVDGTLIDTKRMVLTD